MISQAYWCFSCDLEHETLQKQSKADKLSNYNRLLMIYTCFMLLKHLKLLWIIDAQMQCMILPEFRDYRNNVVEVIIYMIGACDLLCLNTSISL